jgi:transposase
VSTLLAPHGADEQEVMARLDPMPGVGPRAAETRLAESGTAMCRFPTAKHLASGAGLCPGHHDSAGKRRRGKTRQGRRWLRQLFVQMAHAAAKTKGTSLAAPYRRLAARRGKKRALMAVGQTIVVIA